MCPRIPLVSLLLQFSVASATAQVPDLSGRWVLIDASRATANTASELTVHQTSLAMDVRGRPLIRPVVTLSIDRRLDTGVRSEKYPVGLVGGMVGGVDRDGRGLGPNGERFQTRFSTRWEADRFVLETSYYARSGDRTPSATRREVWSLTGPDSLLIEVTDMSSGKQAETARLAYVRRK